MQKHEQPKRNFIHSADFKIVRNDKTLFGVFYLFIGFISASYFKCVSIIYNEISIFRVIQRMTIG